MNVREPEGERRPGRRGNVSHVVTANGPAATSHPGLVVALLKAALEQERGER